MAQTLPVSQVSPIRPINVGDDDVLLINGSLALVTSKSEPGAWWPVEAHVCHCPGATYRGHCRHLDAVREAEEMDRQSAEPVCSKCGIGPWTVRIGGTLFCGSCAPLPGTAEHRAAMMTGRQAERFLDARDARNLDWARGFLR